MKTYSIVQTVSGVELGPFVASSPGEALDVLAQAAGYRNHAHACECADGGDTLRVTEVEGVGYAA